MYSSSKVKNCCDEPGTRDQRYHIDNTHIALACTLLPCLCENRILNNSKCQDTTVHAVKSSPSTILSCVAKAPKYAHVSLIPVGDSDTRSSNQEMVSNLLQDVHIPGRLMEDFLELARENTEKDLETCGVLGAFLEKGTYYVTTLIILKQEATSNSTHPSQSCFMSSIDLHTHFSYQAMIPEAFAIVMAPTDSSRSYGIFRLSSPGGMSVLKECQERGFHQHSEPADGSPIYEHCSNVYTNSNLRFEIFDLR